MSSLCGFRKVALFKRLCSKNVTALIDVFYDDKVTKEHIVNAGIEIVQFIHKSQEIPLPTQRVTRYNKHSRLEFYNLGVSLQQMGQQHSILFEHIYSSRTGLS